MRDLMRIAQIQPAESLAQEAPKGLDGVVVAETEVGDVRGQEGFYHYRQYSAVELAEKRTLEDVWYLLFDGSAPDARAASGVHRRGRAHSASCRRRSQPVLPAIARLGARRATARRSAHHGLAHGRGRSTSSRRSTCPPSSCAHNALQVCAVDPDAAHGAVPAAPRHEPDRAAPRPCRTRPTTSTCSTARCPTPEHARAIEQYLISTIDHGFNASTFTARVITSTGADLGAAVVGAIGALSGPLHGGAPSRALDMLDAIGTTDKAEPWLRDAVERGDRLMGFGHRVYKTDDPRSVLLRGVAERLGGDKVEFAKEVERHGGRRARRAEAGPASSTRTSSSTPAS